MSKPCKLAMMLASSMFAIFSGMLFALASLSGFNAAYAAPKTGRAAETGIAKIEYCRLAFPSRPIAEIVWNVAPGTGSPSAINNKERALACGFVRIPRNIPIKVVLLYDGLQHTSTLEQFNQCFVSEFSAARLEFGDRHLPHIRGFNKLHNLNLDETEVTDKSMAIMASFPELDELRLSSTDIEGTNLELLNSLHSLHNLNLFCTPLKAGALAKIKPLLPDLTSLDLTNTRLSRADAQYLQYLKKIENLNLNGNDTFDDSCMSLLSKLDNLITLELKDTGVTSKSLPILTKLPNLKTVMVRAARFWAPGQSRPKLRAGLQIIDAAEKCRTPIEIFTPVH